MSRIARIIHTTRDIKCNTQQLSEHESYPDNISKWNCCICFINNLSQCFLQYYGYIQLCEECIVIVQSHLKSERFGNCLIIKFACNFTSSSACNVNIDNIAALYITKYVSVKPPLTLLHTFFQNINGNSIMLTYFVQILLDDLEFRIHFSNQNILTKTSGVNILSGILRLNFTWLLYWS